MSDVFCFEKTWETGFTRNAHVDFTIRTFVGGGH